MNLAEWDWLLVSGAVLFAVLFPLSLTLPDRSSACLDRLVAGESLISEGTPLTDATAVKRRLYGQVRAWAHWSAALAAALMLAAWIWAEMIYLANVPLLMMEVLGAALAGLYLGRTIGYGRMGRSLSGQGISIRARPGHPDGVAGLRPVGALFLFNGSIFAAVAAYLAVWPLTDLFDNYYGQWRGPYAVLLAVVVAFSILGFLLPLHWFHIQMRDQKNDYFAEADRAAAESLAMRDASLATSDDDLRRSLDAKVERLAHWYQEVEAMPTWPVDRHIRRRFTSNQVLVFLPLGLKALSVSEEWNEFWTSLGQVLLGGNTQ